VWSKRARCCGGAQYYLEAAVTPPERAFESAAERDGVQMLTACGLRRADHIALELTRRGKLRAYWNNQAWVG
jgi:hypothetical protein